MYIYIYINRCILCHYDVLQKGIGRVRVHANTSERIMAHGQNNTGSCLCISFCWGCCLGCQLEGQIHQWYHFISMHQLASYYSHWSQPISDNTSNPFDSNLLVRRNSACLSPYKYLHNISKHSKTNCKTPDHLPGNTICNDPVHSSLFLPHMAGSQATVRESCHVGLSSRAGFDKGLASARGSNRRWWIWFAILLSMIVSHTELLSTLSSVCSGRSWQNSASFGALGACKCTSLNLAKIGPYVSPDICV